MFEESPAKKEDYTKITGSDIFPLLFCGHRWLEDKGVAERALQIWPQITAYISETLKKPRVKLLHQITFSTVRSAVQDSLITAKLEFFCISCSHLETLSGEIFQADAPLLPFITSELQVMMETLVEKFVETGT